MLNDSIHTLNKGNNIVRKRGKANEPDTYTDNSCVLKQTRSDKPSKLRRLSQLSLGESI